MTALPDGWRRMPLGDVAETALGKMLDRAKDRGLPRVRYLRNVNVQWGRIDTDDVLEMELADDERERFGVEPGDLLVCEGGEIGRAAIWSGSAEYMAYQKALHRVRPHDILDSRFLLHQFAFLAQTNSFDSLSTGSTIRHLPQQQLRRVPVVVPPLDEQRRIVDILEDHLSRLDAANDYLDAVQRRLDRLALARWRSVFGALAEVLGQRPLLDVAVIENGQTPRGLSDRLLNHEVDDSVPFYKVGDMNASGGREMAAARFHVRRQDARELGLHVRQGGLVLFPKRGGAISTNKKRLLTAPAAFDLNTMGLRPKQGVAPKYLWHWLEGIDLGQIADGSNVPQINASQIRRLLIPVPPEDAQADAADGLDAFAAQREAVALECQRAQRRSDRLRRALLAAAFAGQLTGRSSDLDVAEELAYS